MIERPIWKERLVAAWKQATIVWLTGPRRVGKTVLAQSLPDTEFPLSASGNPRASRRVG